ncbi:hypothetical protein CEUSTIGMA_g1900.t1 [Chlamydomonas eustigma]|uniref:Uncharacterized protein n=1 Tax=Chlamydomonas eustigma TaxID=1157962 RepID=A0A250WUG7_9CHLO|nr:hypothetical protein CEUSTIGMA_g1900.t1 [Chlamydomonas eustigma]|eukprot:GAX74451.1 hypothetical protein CEUSTIGMA_g1900.t1 [Chlamydomonas eustigma]
MDVRFFASCLTWQQEQLSSVVQDQVKRPKEVLRSQENITWQQKALSKGSIEFFEERFVPSRDSEVDNAEYLKGTIQKRSKGPRGSVIVSENQTEVSSTADSVQQLVSSHSHLTWQQLHVTEEPTSSQLSTTRKKLPHIIAASTLTWQQQQNHGSCSAAEKGIYHAPQEMSDARGLHTEEVLKTDLGYNTHTRPRGALNPAGLSQVHKYLFGRDAKAVSKVAARCTSASTAESSCSQDGTIQNGILVESSGQRSVTQEVVPAASEGTHRRTTADEVALSSATGALMLTYRSPRRWSESGSPKGIRSGNSAAAAVASGHPKYINSALRPRKSAESAMNVIAPTAVAAAAAAALKALGRVNRHETASGVAAAAVPSLKVEESWKGDTAQHSSILPKSPEVSFDTDGSTRSTRSARSAPSLPASKVPAADNEGHLKPLPHQSSSPILIEEQDRNLDPKPPSVKPPSLFPSNITPSGVPQSLFSSNIWNYSASADEPTHVLSPAAAALAVDATPTFPASIRGDNANPPSNTDLLGNAFSSSLTTHLDAPVGPSGSAGAGLNTGIILPPAAAAGPSDTASAALDLLSGLDLDTLLQLKLTQLQQEMIMNASPLPGSSTPVSLNSATDTQLLSSNQLLGAAPHHPLPPSPYPPGSIEEPQAKSIVLSSRLAPEGSQEGITSTSQHGSENMLTPSLLRTSNQKYGPPGISSSPDINVQKGVFFPTQDAATSTPHLTSSTLNIRKGVFQPAHDESLLPPYSSINTPSTAPHSLSQTLIVKGVFQHMPPGPSLGASGTALAAATSTSTAGTAAAPPPSLLPLLKSLGMLQQGTSTGSSLVTRVQPPSSASTSEPAASNNTPGSSFLASPPSSWHQQKGPVVKAGVYMPTAAGDIAKSATQHLQSATPATTSSALPNSLRAGNPMTWPALDSAALNSTSAAAGHSAAPVISNAGQSGISLQPSMFSATPGNVQPSMFSATPGNVQPSMFSATTHNTWLPSTATAGVSASGPLSNILSPTNPALSPLSATNNAISTAGVGGGLGASLFLPGVFSPAAASFAGPAVSHLFLHAAAPTSMSSPVAMPSASKAPLAASIVFTDTCYLQQPTTYQLQPTISQQQPATYQLQPTISQQQPATYQQQPTTYQLQPTISQQQPATYQQQPLIWTQLPASSSTYISLVNAASNPSTASALLTNWTSVAPTPASRSVHTVVPPPALTITNMSQQILPLTMGGSASIQVSNPQLTATPTSHTLQLMTPSGAHAASSSVTPLPSRSTWPNSASLPPSLPPPPPPLAPSPDTAFQSHLVSHGGLMSATATASGASPLTLSAAKCKGSPILTPLQSATLATEQIAEGVQSLNLNDLNPHSSPFPAGPSTSAPFPPHPHFNLNSLKSAINLPADRSSSEVSQLRPNHNYSVPSSQATPVTAVTSSPTPSPSSSPAEPMTTMATISSSYLLASSSNSTLEGSPTHADASPHEPEHQSKPSSPHHPSSSSQLLPHSYTSITSKLMEDLQPRSSTADSFSARIQEGIIGKTYRQQLGAAATEAAAVLNGTSPSFELCSEMLVIPTSMLPPDSATLNGCPLEDGQLPVKAQSSTCHVSLPVCHGSQDEATDRAAYEAAVAVVLMDEERLRRQREEEEDELYCVVCMERPKSMVLEPCGHMTLCMDCCTFIRASSQPLVRVLDHALTSFLGVLNMPHLSIFHPEHDVLEVHMMTRSDLCCG